MERESDATQLLTRAADGDELAAADVFPAVYEELRRLAHRFMDDQARGHTLQPTALVHEAFLRLVDVPRLGAGGERSFVRLAARAMRTILIDHARRKRSDKRGGARKRMALHDDVVAIGDADPLDWIDLDAALTRLEAVDPQLARIAELRLFAGQTTERTADALGISTRSVERGFRMARMWLIHDLEEREPDGSAT